jgi:putative addiction module component
MGRLTTLLLRLTPDERLEIAREVASRVASADDFDVEAEWLRALERRFGGDEPEQLPLWEPADLNQG